MSSRWTLSAAIMTDRHLRPIRSHRAASAPPHEGELHQAASGIHTPLRSQKARTP